MLIEYRLYANIFQALMACHFIWAYLFVYRYILLTGVFLGLIRIFIKTIYRIYDSLWLLCHKVWLKRLKSGCKLILLICVLLPDRRMDTILFTNLFLVVKMFNYTIIGNFRLAFGTILRFIEPFLLTKRHFSIFR